MSPRLIALLVLFICWRSAFADSNANQPSVCDIVEPILDKFSAYPLPAVTSFCSSLLHYPSVHAKTTTTITVRTKTTTTQTVKTRKIVRTTTTRSTLTITELVVKTSTFTSNVPYTTPPPRVRRDVAQAPSYQPPLAIDGQGEVLGSPLSLASEACSCIVTKPTSTITKRVTSTSTISTTTTTTRTNTKTRTLYPITTVTKTRTRSITLTNCIGTNPTPAFKIQIVDTDPNLTDEYNNQFVSYAPFAPGLGDGEDKLSAVTSINSAKTFYRDCIGRLATDGSFGVPEYFIAIGSSDASPLYLYNQTGKLGYGSQAGYVYCSLDSGFLSCYYKAPYTNNPRQKLLQTTELYELLDTYIVIGTEVGPNGFFYPFRWKTYPA